MQCILPLAEKKGYGPAYPDVKSLGGGALFQAGKRRYNHDGSWNIQTYIRTQF